MKNNAQLATLGKPNSIQNESEITNYPNVFKKVFIKIENILSKPHTNYFKGDNRAYNRGPVSAYVIQWEYNQIIIKCSLKQSVLWLSPPPTTRPPQQ